jgi:hypothetical protein
VARGKQRRSQLQTDQQIHFKWFFWGNLFNLLKFSIVCGTIVGVVAFFYLSVDTLAGRSTSVTGSFNGSLTGALKLVTNKHMGEVLAYSITALTGGAFTHDRIRRRRMGKRSGQPDAKKRLGGRHAA